MGGGDVIIHPGGDQELAAFASLLAGFGLALNHLHPRLARIVDEAVLAQNNFS